MDPANYSSAINEILRRYGVVLASYGPPCLADIEGVEEFALCVGKKLVTGAEPGLEPCVMLRQIDAHRVYLHARLLEFAEILLQLAELQHAERSPITLVESKKRWPLRQYGR